jgi:hypothetical protein
MLFFLLQNILYQQHTLQPNHLRFIHKIYQKKHTSNMKNVFLYFSAFVPLYVLILIKFICGTLVKTIDVTILTILTFVVFGLLTVLGIVGLLWNLKGKTQKQQQIKILQSQNVTDQHFLSYFSLFVLYALGFELTKPSMLTVSLMIVVMIGIVYVNNKMFFINPLLNILGYNFYKITFTTKENPAEQTMMVFCRGALENKTYKVKIQNQNFAFIDKK